MNLSYLELGPMWRALMRNKVGALLIAIQIAVTMTIVINSISIVVEETSNIISETVFGTFADCNENPIANGYVVLTYGEQSFYDTVTDGTFEINVLRCSSENSFSIEAVDTDNLQTTGAINYTFDTAETNLGNLLACDAVTEFIKYTVDDTEELLITSSTLTITCNAASSLSFPFFKLQPKNPDSIFIT